MAVLRFVEFVGFGNRNLCFGCGRVGVRVEIGVLVLSRVEKGFGQVVIGTVGVEPARVSRMTPVSLSCKSIAFRAAVGRWSSIAMSMISSSRSIARSTLPCRAPCGEYPASRAAWAKLAPRATWSENNSLRDDSGGGGDAVEVDWETESMAGAFGGRDGVRPFYRLR